MSYNDAITVMKKEYITLPASFCITVWEGSMEFETTHRDTYKEIKGDYRAKPVVHKDKASVGKRGKFSDETQFKHDFPGFGSKQPLPPKPAEPAPTTIDLKFNNM